MKPFICMIAYTDYDIDARVRREAETLASNGFHVRCFTSQNGAKRTRFVLNGVEVCELGIRRYRGKSMRVYATSYLRFLLSASLICLRLLLKRQLDVVHVHNVPDFLVIAGLLPRLAGRKVILDIHDSVPEFFATKFSGPPILGSALRLEERLSALVANKVICVNHPQRGTLVARGIPMAKTFISMNIADPAIFNRSAADPRPSPRAGSFDLVYHGTMAHRLGVDLIIRAAARLRECIPSLHLHLWGHGDDLAGFQRLAADLDLEGTVSFKPDGYPLEQLPRYLASMDLGVVGNRPSPGCDLMLPVKLIEYVALGIPAVVPRLTAIARYFSDDMVSYYEADDVPSLANAIHRLYGQPAARRLQADNASSFLQNYGWQHQGPDLVAFYRQLLAS